MTTDIRPSLSEALTKFIAAKKNGRGVKLDHRELSRFVAWLGRERNVIEVTPAEMAEYHKIMYRDDFANPPDYTVTRSHGSEVDTHYLSYGVTLKRAVSSVATMPES